jgi:hypothetical protein
VTAREATAGPGPAAAEEPADVLAPGRRWAWRAGVAALGTAAVISSLSGPWQFLVGSVTGSPATSQPAACLPGTAVPVLDSPHVSAAELASARYNSVPPTSGPHFGFTIAPGSYPGPLSAGLTVHAMEHGHVIIQYAPGTGPDPVRQLERLAKRYGRDVILAPYPGLASGIALTAWGRIDRIEQYDEARATRFIESLRNRYVHGWTRPDGCPQP